MTVRSPAIVVLILVTIVSLGAGIYYWSEAQELQQALTTARTDAEAERDQLTSDLEALRAESGALAEVQAAIEAATSERDALYDERCRAERAADRVDG